MRTFSSTPSSASLHDGSIFDTLVGNAIDVGMNELGLKHGLPTMQWRVWSLDGGPSIEGFPLIGTADPEGACLAWAHALELDEYTFDAGDNNRTWYLSGGRWHVEIMTVRPDDADDSDDLDPSSSLTGSLTNAD
jgi:hypothetical protein